MIGVRSERAMMLYLAELYVRMNGLEEPPSHNGQGAMSHMSPMSPMTEAADVSMAVTDLDGLIPPSPSTLPPSPGTFSKSINQLRDLVGGDTTQEGGGVGGARTGRGVSLPPGGLGGGLGDAGAGGGSAFSMMDYRSQILAERMQRSVTVHSVASLHACLSVG